MLQSAVFCSHTRLHRLWFRLVIMYVRKWGYYLDIVWNLEVFFETRKENFLKLVQWKQIRMIYLFFHLLFGMWNQCVPLTVCRFQICTYQWFTLGWGVGQPRGNLTLSGFEMSNSLPLGHHYKSNSHPWDHNLYFLKTQIYSAELLKKITQKYQMVRLLSKVLLAIVWWDQAQVFGLICVSYLE